MLDTSPMCEFELQILAECAGVRDARPWAAAVGAALKTLRSGGYIIEWKVTPKGEAVLARHGILPR